MRSTSTKLWSFLRVYGLIKNTHLKKKPKHKKQKKNTHISLDFSLLTYLNLSPSSVNSGINLSNLYTVDPWTMQGLGTRMLSTVKNSQETYNWPSVFTVPPYLWFCIHRFNQLEIHPTKNCVAFTNEKKIYVKSVQTHVVQRSAVLLSMSTVVTLDQTTLCSPEDYRSLVYLIPRLPFNVCFLQLARVIFFKMYF